MTATLLILVWMAADITVVVTPSPTNVVITITVQPMAATATNVVVVATQAMADVQAVPVMPAVVVTPAVAAARADALARLPRSYPVPPLPFYTDSRRPFEATFIRPLPGGTNDSYGQYQARLAEAAARGLRRSE